jgi:hypothetical protein
MNISYRYENFSISLLTYSLISELHQHHIYLTSDLKTLLPSTPRYAHWSQNSYQPSYTVHLTQCFKNSPTSPLTCISYSLIWGLVYQPTFLSQSLNWNLFYQRTSYISYSWSENFLFSLLKFLTHRSENSATSLLKYLTTYLKTRIPAFLHILLTDPKTRSPSFP